MKKIVLITGGQRSGKSSYGEKLALEFCAKTGLDGEQKPLYVATARVWDEEFAERVARHRQVREDKWENREEEKRLSRIVVAGRIVLVDCVTLWATNFFFDESTRLEQTGAFPQDAEDAGSIGSFGEETLVERVLNQIKAEFDRFTAQEAVFVFVTNEIGLGEVSTNRLQRQFTDLQGWLNQYIASQADEVVWMVSGIPVRIKGEMSAGDKK